jgi:3-isopropylmalate/(R)-2-methylmalate dehydratase large subunit
VLPASSSSTYFQLSGNILYLREDSAAMQSQLAGLGDPSVDLASLRDEISTDEIIPARHCLHVDSTLGRHVLTGLSCGGIKPVARDAVKSGRFEVLVAGNRYGKGSSRESAPLAEWHAGVRLVIARSFERIYRENAHNIGLLTSTDMDLLPRLLRGEQISLDELVAGLDTFSRIIVRSGGLLSSASHLAQLNALSPSKSPATPLSYGYKILARAAGLPSVQAGQSVMVRPDWRFAYDLSTAMAANLLSQHMGRQVQMAEPRSILLFQDHLALIQQAPLRDGISQVALAQQLMLEQRQFAATHGIALHDGGQQDGSEGICHTIISERYAQPGQLICGTDSHSSHAGATGALAFGVGTTAMAHAFVTRQICVSVPPVSRIRVMGRLRTGVQAKDLVLYLLRMPLLRQGGLVGHLIH